MARTQRTRSNDTMKTPALVEAVAGDTHEAAPAPRTRKQPEGPKQWKPVLVLAVVKDADGNIMDRDSYTIEVVAASKNEADITRQAFKSPGNKATLLSIELGDVRSAR